MPWFKHWLGRSQHHSVLPARVFTAGDLPLTLYLNQRLTFDILAALEDGFSHFTTEQKTSVNEGTRERGFQLGAGNPFALLSVQLRRTLKEVESASKEQTLVHTPASLFSRLRWTLREEGLIRNIQGPNDLEQVHAGCFIEFEAPLQRSPLVECLEAVEEVIPMINVFSQTDQFTPPDPNARKRSKSRSNKTPPSPEAVLLNQIQVLRRALTEDKAEDLVAEVGGVRAIITTEEQYFNDPSMNDIIDGTFRVFGKATRVVPKDSDSPISLLRKTSFSKFEGLEKAIVNLTNNDVLKFKAPLDTWIGGPALQVLPIAIFS